MSFSRNDRPESKVLALPPLQLPFETWRPIFQSVYATKNHISHPPSDFVISPLNARLNIYRCLASVCKLWRANARDVFFEDIDGFTIETLKGLIRTFQLERSLALAVSRISFSFWEFRCSVSTPRRLRRLQPATPDQASGSSPVARTPDWKAIHRRDAARYVPSSTSQASHWSQWQADVAQILTMCSSLSDVRIVGQSNADFRSHGYLAWFPPPNLENENVLNGLLRSTNLRSLDIVDPTPLDRYGPSFASWERLQNLSITLTRNFDDLPDTAFIPPKRLKCFRFHDMSPGKFPWPLASDLGNCSNLQVLDLGVPNYRIAPNATMAIGYLCKAYQSSLQELTLRIFHSPDDSFQDLFESSIPKLHFSNLQRLRLPHASYDTSFFSHFTADQLEYVEVGWLTIEPGTGSREEQWSRGLRHASLKHLKKLVITQDDPDTRRREALENVCNRLDVELLRRPPAGESEAFAPEVVYDARLNMDEWEVV